MIFVPLSFLVSLYLAVFLVRLLLRGRESFAANGLFLLLIAVYIVQTVLIGLRWGYGVMAVLPLQMTLATLMPPLSYLAFRDLARERHGLSWRDWPHLVPTAALMLMMLVWRDLLDLLIIAEFLAYGLALLWLARLGPDGLVAARLDGTLRSYRSLQLTGLALIGSALTDIAISLDMLWSGGQYSALVVSASTTAILLLLGIAAVAAGSEEGEGDGQDEMEGLDPAPKEGRALGLTHGTEQPSAATVVSPEDRQVAADLDRLMVERRLYADTGLNLARIARRMGLPARSVSQAVNRVHGISVSHYVNNHRIGEACRLLAETDLPVTRIVFDSGFMTKSNFNREFLRVTGMSPSDWRRQSPRSAEDEATVVATGRRSIR
ncbi:helix-turn-helix domain-containing protein [Rhizobium sp. SL42]|uniref:helix-turn-helix domain-containing protein n=1 Tax=Rhizobium sp. SL42 TaxID=2806346 RepID=UPI001F31EAE7|nr:AraC family transcriptional regulator [Rhizobium sp. SL42]UJW76496.1 helix-turn-helix transcriptional regulator [Rhizobium sp. SL42]